MQVSSSDQPRRRLSLDDCPSQSISLKSVSAWPTVVENTGASSSTTALNLLREAERRLGEAPSATLPEKLSSGQLNK